VSTLSARGPFGTSRPLSIAALDAAISETIGKPVRADRLARDDRVYRWICRRAIAEGSLRFNTTYAEAASGAGYPVPRLNCRANRREAREHRVSTVYRALCSLQGAGLVRFHGVKRTNGQWRCLSVGLTPAGYGQARAFGRSRRGPRRRPGHRISFSHRSGTSPPVATAKNGPRVVSVGAHARAGPETAARGKGGAFLAAVLAPVEAQRDPSYRRPWPNERFDLLDTEAVELVELFEDAFGLPARFSYERHGPILRRILERFDRYSGPAGAGRRAGFKHAAALIKRQGALFRAGNVNVRHIKSLPYFLPRFDQDSKRRRREWKRTYGPIWAETETP
jgi:hypothetical protein